MYILTLIMFPIVEKFFLFYLCGSPLEAIHLDSLKISQDLSRGELRSSRTQRPINLEEL